MHLIYVNRTRVNMLRLNIFLYIVAYWQHLVVILLAWLILCRHQCSCYASVNSSCAQPPPPQATAGHLPSLSVPRVGHLQILHCPGTGHLPTPGQLASFWHARSFLSEYNYTEGFTGKKQTGSPVKDRNKLKRIVKACSRFYAYISSLLVKPELHSENRNYRCESTCFGYWIKSLLILFEERLFIFI